MEAESDDVIIKRKSRHENAYENVVHTAESLINQGLLGNVCCISAGLSK